MILEKQGMVLDESHEWVVLFLNVRKKNEITISVYLFCCVLDTWLSTYQGSQCLEKDSGLFEVYRRKRQGIRFVTIGTTIRS